MAQSRVRVFRNTEKRGVRYAAPLQWRLFDADRRATQERRSMNPSIHAHGGYSRAQIALHWLSVALMCSLVLAGELRHLLVEHADMRMRPIMIVHIGSGMALLVVMLMRSRARAAPAHRRDHPCSSGAPTSCTWPCMSSCWANAWPAGSSSTPRAWSFRCPARAGTFPSGGRRPATGLHGPGPRMAGLPALRPAGRAHRRRAVASLGRRDGTLGHMGRPAGAWRGADSACRTRPERRPGAGARGFAQIRNSGRIRSRLDSG